MAQISPPQSDAARELPQVVRLQIEKGVIVRNCDVYIGRQCFRGGWQPPAARRSRLRKSAWSNPFSCSKHSREEAIKLYRNYILGTFLSDPASWTRLLADLATAKSLGCWCKPQACHGDVLVGFLRRYFAKQKELIPDEVAALAREMLKEAEEK